MMPRRFHVTVGCLSAVLLLLLGSLAEVSASTKVVHVHIRIARPPVAPPPVFRPPVGPPPVFRPPVGPPPVFRPPVGPPPVVRPPLARPPLVSRPIFTGGVPPEMGTSPSRPPIQFVTITEKNALQYNKYVDLVAQLTKKEMTESLKEHLLELIGEALAELLANSDPPTTDTMTTPTSVVATNFPTYTPPCTNEQVDVFDAWNNAFADCSGSTEFGFRYAILRTKQDLVCSNGCISRRAEIRQKLFPTCVVTYNGVNVDMSGYFFQLVSPCWSW